MRAYQLVSPQAWISQFVRLVRICKTLGSQDHKDELASIQQELHSYKSKLSAVLGEFDGIRTRQKELRYNDEYR
jgi:hypothetical protein